MKPIMGQYQESIADYLSNLKYPVSFLSDIYSDVDAWLKEARAMVRALLSYEPPETPFNVQINDEYAKDGLIYQHISYEQPFGPRSEEF